MKRTLKFSLLVVAAILISSCNRRSTSKSTLTGLEFNNPKYGNFLKIKNYKGQKTPLGMVPIEGGTFTMGSVQDDVMFDWNATPRQIHVRSFYMDETEVTNSEYGLFVQYMRKIYPPEKEEYKHIYPSVLPDTLVWRKGLGNTDLLSESYFRHPSYAEYPVVGVSWLQANRYCQWRTDAVNLKILMDKGVIDPNLIANDSISYTGADSFNTEVYLTDPNKLFGGDSLAYKRGLPVPRKRGEARPTRDQFSGRHVTSTDGILAQKFRLPTEAEWEFAAKADIENREYNTIRGKKKYAWKGYNTRDKRRRYKGDQLANYKQGKGNYSGISGWSSDGSDIPIAVKSYPPNAFGLYDMSGNVAEWVADVYRPIIDDEANDFNYFRGNIFTKKMIDNEGKVVIIDNNNIVYDTLANGKVVPKQLPGAINYVPISDRDTYLRRNYNRSDNSDLNDGDFKSSKNYALDKDQYATATKMYNSPERPEEELDSLGRASNEMKYDTKKRTTLISNKTRVYKGGSWADRDYWLDPAQRRYFPQYMATNYIGFRCASDRVGAMTNKKRKPRTRIR